MNPESLYAQIGERISASRRSNRLRQHELADRVGISRASLANIEVGRQKILVHQLCAIAVALKLPPADLIPETLAPIPADNLPLPQGLKPQQRDQIARLLSDPPPEARHNKDVTDGKKKT